MSKLVSCALLQVNRDLYEGLSDPVKQRLLCTLFDVSVDSTRIEVTSQLRRVLKHVGHSVEAKYNDFMIRKIWFPCDQQNMVLL